jgi:gliding motility-associated-like protein
MTPKRYFLPTTLLLIWIGLLLSPFLTASKPFAPLKKPFCLPNDSLALVTFYNSTGGGTTWNAWNLNTPFSTWQGVEVDAAGCVVKLILPNAGLIGTIPNSIFTGDNLKKLRVLNLSNNALTGTIPAALGGLGEIQIIELSRNQLSGAIPPSLGSANSLRQLLLAENNLTGTIPNTLGNLDSLVRLNLSRNGLSGNIPAELGNLSTLRYLDLGNNLLENEVPAALTNLSPTGMAALDTCWLNSNRLTFVPTFNPISALNLRLENNRLTFSSIAPNNNGTFVFTYSPQDSVGTVRQITVYQNTNYTDSLTIDPPAVGNLYRWYKDNTPLAPTATTNGYILSLTDIQPTDAGNYFLRVTNLDAPNLTLFVRVWILTVKACPGNNDVTSPNLTLCEGEPLPASIFGSTATLGDVASFSYQWQISNNSITWTNAPPPSNLKNYPLAGFTASDTTYFRRLLLSECDTNFSNIMTLAIVPAFGTNEISPANQSVCLGIQPQDLVGTFPADTLGKGFTYLWQISTDAGSTWLDAATTVAYTPPILNTMDTILVRRIVLGSCVPDTSNVAALNPIAPLVADTIYRSQYVCIGALPDPIAPKPPQGGDPSDYRYYWETATNLDSADWSLADSLVSSLQLPQVTDTVFVRLITRSACFSDTSNIITLTTAPNLENDSTAISISRNEICLGDSIPNFIGAPAGIDSAFFFVWEVSTNLNPNTGFWTAVDSAQNWDVADSILFGTIFNTIPDSFFVRRRLVDSCQTYFSNILTVRLIKPIDSASNLIKVPSQFQKLCAGDTTWQILANAATGGSSRIRYQWQVSFNRLTWGNRDDSLQIKPFALLDTTYFRRIAYDSCSSDTSNVVQINIIQNFGLNFIETNQTEYCVGDSATFVINGTPPEGEGNYIYRWEYSPDSLTWFASDTSVQNFTPDTVFTGRNFYRRIIEGGCSLDTSNVLLISIKRTPQNNRLIRGRQTICQGDSADWIIGTVPFTTENDSIVITWQISFDSLDWVVVPNDSITAFHIGAPSDTVYIRRTARAGDCLPNISNVIRVSVVQPLANNFISSSQLLCEGSVADTLFGTRPIGGDTATYSYIWQRSFLDDTTGTWVTVSARENFAPGVITRSVQYRRIVNSRCFSDTSNVVILLVSPQFERNAIAPEGFVCRKAKTFPLEGNVILDSAGLYGDFRYQWQSSPDRRNWTDLPNTNVPTYKPAPLDTTTFFRRLVINKCFRDSSNVLRIEVRNNPTVTITPDTTISIGNAIQLQATGGLTYLWTPKLDIEGDSTATPTVRPLISRYYYVEVSNVHGCITRDSVFITVIGIPDVRTVDAITPNGDGLNDQLYIEGIEKYPDNELIVFNRWGQEVYRRKEYRNDWEGTYNGKVLPSGTYFYIIKFGITREIIKGAFEIIR